MSHIVAYWFYKGFHRSNKTPHWAENEQQVGQLAPTIRPLDSLSLESYEIDDELFNSEDSSEEVDVEDSTTK